MVEVVGIVVVVVDVVGLVLVVLVVDGQSPRFISSSFVVAPTIQVPALPPDVSALLHPQIPVHSRPHLTSMHGSPVVAVIDVEVVLLLDDVEEEDEDGGAEVVASALPDAPEKPDDPEPDDDPSLHTSLMSLQQSPLIAQNSSQKHA